MSSRKTNIYRGIKKGGLGQFAGLRGWGWGLDKKEGVVFLRWGVDTPMQTMNLQWLPAAMHR